MKFVRLNGTTLRYRVSGAAEGPAIVFANSLGTDLTVWDEVVERLPDTYRMVGFDKRGHGLSAMPEGPVRIEDYATDLVHLANHLGIKDFIVCGVSVGGLIAQATATLAPNRVRGIVLSNTGAKIGNDAMWNERIAIAETQGMEAMADAVMERWFPSAFHASNPELIAGYRAMLTRTPAAGYASTSRAIRDADFIQSTSQLTLPTLCIGGELDGATPTSLVKELAGLIPGAEYHEIPGCGHLPSVQNPEACTNAILAFLTKLKTDS
ncbi:MAG: 3-oxoadipate enol-lactonase [Pseudomonadota bacterium]